MSEHADHGRETTPASQTLPPEPKPQMGPEQAALGVFVGEWRGHARGEPRDAVEEVCDWLEGRFFIQCRFDQRFGGARHTGVSLIGCDQSAGRYFVRMVDNLGYARDYDLSHVGGDVWTMSGERERARYTFDGSELSVRWEHRPEGRPWEELCEYQLKNWRTQRPH